MNATEEITRLRGATLTDRDGSKIGTVEGSVNPAGNAAPRDEGSPSLIVGVEVRNASKVNVRTLGSRAARAAERFRPAATDCDCCACNPWLTCRAIWSGFPR